ncbi:MAG: glycosyltransferase family 4 protein [Candidatus Eiseniibacteriota bacterium]
MTADPKIAIVHEWLVTVAGAERVLSEMLSCFPAADLYAVVDFLPDGVADDIKKRVTGTTFIQALPCARTRYRNYLPLMPLAIEQLDLSAYDIVISSSHAVAKGVITGPDQLHVSYVHTPMRYIWDLQHQYLRESGLDRGIKGYLARWLLHRLRLWDVRTSTGVDRFIANSAYVRRRIAKTYRRDAQVIYPPVDVTDFTPGGAKEDFYLAASRLVPYKRIDLIVEAFAAMPERRLMVIGDGPDRRKVERGATPNVTLLGHQSRDAMIDYMRRARALVFAAEEDFGILPVEVQACGTPVLAYGKGGALETVIPLGRDNPTGLFFEVQTPAAIRQAVDRFEAAADRFTVQNCRNQALRFSAERFRGELGAAISTAWTDWQAEHHSSNWSPGWGVAP